MKKFLQFSGLIAAVVAIVAFILMLACPAIKYTPKIGDPSYIDGVVGIFGKTASTDIGGFNISGQVYKATVSAIIAFILLIAAIVILLVGAILPLFKITVLNKFSGLLNLIALAACVVAGVLIFIEVPCFAAAQSTENVQWSTDGYALGAGWIISAICAIVAGALAIAPAFANFLAKGKKRK